MLGYFPIPFGLEGFSAGTFFSSTLFLSVGSFFDEPLAFLADLMFFARAFGALDRVAVFSFAFGLLDFVEAFFFGDFAINSVAPLGCRARAEA